ncbi:OmpA family protein [Aureisphaera galaxeae]|uniref:OmpA family protein n=1 Tax=Aureisphaera galaxeae TaxID=1538023 RepID=UPI0023509772|nr:OmpA family protein [Aureisphaera galaxeae]MDC8002419.1 OmpA family protein [Aureisphaera galaxeae]
MRKIDYLVLMACMMVSFISFSQETNENNKETRGDRYYEEYAFMDAREAYIRAVDKGYRSKNLLAKLGDSYYFNGEYEEASKWYGALFAYSESIDSEYIYRYAQSLKTIGKYATADRIMEKLDEVATTDDRADLFVEEKNYLKLIELQSGRFTISSVPFNSKYSDFAPTLNGGEVIFTSNRKTRTASQRFHDWDDEPFSELYSITVSEEGNPERYRDRINTRYHESSAVFTKDGRTMYFTRNNFTEGRRGRDGNGHTNLKLYRAERTDRGWGNAEELPFNSDEYSVAHPALSADETELIFASDMPGGEGASDLYKVKIQGDGFGDPVSLGDIVNTEGRETFPFVDTNGDLYFASDGHVGLGGLDIFVAELGQDGNYQKGYNIGEPVNSKADDFSFVINSSTGLGYFASNREGGRGGDDIYSFEQTAGLIKECRQSLNGEVRDNDSQDLIAGAKVILLDGDTNVLEETTSDREGKFYFDIIECTTKYSIRASKDGFGNSEKMFTTTGEYDGISKKTLYLNPDKEVDIMEVGQDLGVLLNLNPIYFDLSKSFIRPDAASELQKVITAMRDNPTLKIDVRSHTDSRSSAGFNMRLSDARAKSTVDYIVNIGRIDRSRITGRGYGESQLLNRCSDGVPCNETEHQLNRRSEFIIVEK